MGEHRGRILVVDDNRTNRVKLSLSLEQQGHTVGLAADGFEALAKLREETFDVVLLDVMMPGLDGFQVLEQAKADPELRDIPVIVISALDETESAVRCIEIGAEDYLPKPFNPVLLRARLNASLQKKRLRDLEKAYLQQEVALRQSEKLAALGRLSAGMAHEMNNPAAAAQRGATQLREVLTRLQQALLDLGGLGLSGVQTQTLYALQGRALDSAARVSGLDSLARSDRETRLEGWLGERGVGNAWEVAPTLVDLGFEDRDLNEVAAVFEPSRFSAALTFLSATRTAYDLVEEVGQGAGRIVEIVNALKAYSFMDQAPVQSVDIHQGLENTLAVLRSKMGTGITVERQLAPDLPLVQAYGSDLNQVWTNLIDNAVDALEGRGVISLRTCHDPQWVVVEVGDNGPGIPEEARTHLFAPFFTTKPVGKGAGLGLNICHNIVVQKHKGRIDIASRPGQTTFTVRLPLALPNAAAEEGRAA